MGMLDGLRVVEMGLWVAVPAAGGIMADWGADVVKIEPPAGDPMRAMFRLSAGSLVDRNPPFDLDNRGKRSVSWSNPIRASASGRMLVTKTSARSTTR